MKSKINSKVNIKKEKGYDQGRKTDIHVRKKIIKKSNTTKYNNGNINKRNNTNKFRENKLLKERRDKEIYKYINTWKLKETGTEEILTKETNTNKMMTSRKWRNNKTNNYKQNPDKSNSERKTKKITNHYSHHEH